MDPLTLPLHEVADVVELSHDTKRIRLSLGGKSTSLGAASECEDM